MAKFRTTYCFAYFRNGINNYFRFWLNLNKNYEIENQPVLLVVTICSHWFLNRQKFHLKYQEIDDRFYLWNDLSQTIVKKDRKISSKSPKPLTFRKFLSTNYFMTHEPFHRSVIFHLMIRSSFFLFLWNFHLEIQMNFNSFA